MSTLYYESSFSHHGIKGQRWGIRRYQNPDGSLTNRGNKRYIRSDGGLTVKARNDVSKDVKRVLFTKNLFDAMDNASEQIKKSEKPMNDFLRSKISSKYIDDFDREDMISDINDGIIKYNSGPYKKYADDHGIDSSKLQHDYDAAHQLYREASNSYVKSVIEEVRGVKINDIVNKELGSWNISDPINSEIVINALRYNGRR